MSDDKREEIQHDALQEIIRHPRCTAAVSMRVGKTYLGLQRLNILYKRSKQLNALKTVKFLVAAPKKSIYESWKNEAKKFNLEYLLPMITFTTYISLNKRDYDYDMVILDEVHSVLPSSLPWLTLYTGPILGLTGTPPKYDNSVKGGIIKRFCPVVYSYITNDAVNDRVLNDYRVIVHLLPISDKDNMPVKKRDGGVFYSSERKTYDFWGRRIFEANSAKQKQIASIMRMKAMQDFPSKVEYAEKLLKDIENKCLVFANTKEQANKLCTHSYHSGNPKSKENLKAFSDGKIDKLACVAQLSEGITITDLNTCLILHSYSNEKSLLQRLSRTLSLGPDEMATIHILAFKETCDADKWVPQALEDLDQSKIRYVEFTN